MRGTTTNPMTRDDVAAKAVDLMSPAMGPRARALIDLVWDLDRQPSLVSIAALLQSGAEAPATKVHAERGRIR